MERELLSEIPVPSGGEIELGGGPNPVVAAPGLLGLQCV